MPHKRRRMLLCEAKTMRYLKEEKGVRDRLKYYDMFHSRQADYLSGESDYPLYDGTSSEYLSPGEIFLPRFLEELRKAEKYIFIEFFILAEGVMWNQIYEILKEKAKAGLENTGLISVADDSGICVDYLGGAPGIYSARYSGEHGDDESNNDKLLSELEGVPLEKRTGRYVAAIACVFPDGREFTVRGECEGKIAFERQGTQGFGYDPLFISELGCFGLLSDEQKDSISHRGKALRLFKERLEEEIKC